MEVRKLVGGIVGVLFVLEGGGWNWLIFLEWYDEVRYGFGEELG